MTTVHPDLPDFSADFAAMARLADGDKRALDELMARWSGPVLAFLQRFTQNQATAEDLAQETFVRLYQSRDRFRPTGSFSSYLFQIAANLARNHARWKSRHPEEELDETAGPQPAARGAQPWEAAAGREVVADVQTAIAGLPEDLRAPLLLAVYHDMSRAEIAVALGCTAKAVEMRIYRARQALKSALARHLS